MHLHGGGRRQNKKMYCELKKEIGKVLRQEISLGHPEYGCELKLALRQMGLDHRRSKDREADNFENGGAVWVFI